ncbi:hypothetical protein, partial [Helicobacter sp. MIT 05-5294]|uniref:hypothetical protein n=1 Tax=Helicobacter sp. MIT 05-5294 TaxID=1548150 RepID=UPI001EE99270
AGLKNFTGVNDNNFGTSLNAVANLKYCNGLPIQTSQIRTSVTINTNYTMTISGQVASQPQRSSTSRGLYKKNSEILFPFFTLSASYSGRMYSGSFFFMANKKDVILIDTKTTISDSSYETYTIYGG